MKKKRITNTLALMLALTMAIGSSLTVCAYEDGCVHHENEGNGESVEGEGGAGIPGSSGGSSNSSNSGSSSHSSGSSSHSSGSSSYDTGSSYDAGSGDSGSSSSGTSYSAPAPTIAGTEVTAGKESFKALAKPAAGTYKVTHKGTEIATFHLMDADKKSVACTKVSLKQGDDKKWAIDFEVADTKGLTVGAPLDRTYMYDTLGVSYVTINDEIVIDIEAESAAKTAK